MPKTFNRAIRVGGEKRVISSTTVQALLYDGNGDILVATGTTVPSTGAGFAKSCLFIDTDVATGSKALYENVGTNLVASFNLIGDISGSEIASGAISVEHLDSGILPSHVVKFAGEFTTAGGDAAEQASVAGVLATDIVVASILDNGTNNVTLLQSAAGTDVIDFTMSGDPSTDCVISYAVFRAVA